MQALIQLGALFSDDDWTALSGVVATQDSQLLQDLFQTWRDAGAKSFLFEEAYIDRDFSAAYSAFYASLFHPYLKYCRRIHFFSEDVRSLEQEPSAEAVVLAMETMKPAYLGFIVLRPVGHAPVCTAILACDRTTIEAAIQYDVVASHPVHLLGVDFEVLGFPLTQQDTRVGACAQAAMWMAGRHFHRKHGGPWFSMPDINEAAVKHADNFIARSLPAGSEFLTPDSIVRALRAMDRHPVFHLGRPAVKDGVELRPLHEVIARYLDSGIPVIIGLRARPGETAGHAVVATGRVMREARDTQLPDNPTSAELISHVLVCDDQRGMDCRLPVRSSDLSDDYPWTIEDDALYAVTPLPSKVFMTGDAAEKLARNFLSSCILRVDEYRQIARRRGAPKAEALAAGNTVDPSFFAVDPSRLVARTYLTHGWRYRSRALRNRLSSAFKAELLGKQFPRYVWVTEFSLPDDLRGFDMCQRKVRAHVVVDATGSQFGASTLVVQVPGLSMFWTFDAASPGRGQTLVLRETDEAETFYPKVRGWMNYDQCRASGSGA